MQKIHTDFLPAERESFNVLKGQELLIKNKISSEILLDAVPIFYLILNDKRQIVLANKTVFESTGIDKENVIGLRPGELFNCIHSDETIGGCGTTLFCRLCGVAKSISLGLAGKKNLEECRIIQKNGNALNLMVYSTPLTIDNNMFTIFSILDISHEKRKLALERIFFHDIMNLVGSLRGWISLLDEVEPNEYDDIKNTLYLLSNNIIDEIRTQKILSEAENNELLVNENLIMSYDLLNSVIQTYKNQDISKNKHIIIDNKSINIEFYSDLVLIKRVLSNLIKNALESSDDNSTIIIGSEKRESNIEFWVHNASYIPEDIQKQLFLRFFSTKGIGRGLGTYSIKLLTERYLKGKVSYTSNKENGTTFIVSYPLKSN